MFKHLQSIRNARASPLAYHVAEKGSTATGRDACRVLIAWGGLLDYNRHHNFVAPFSTEAAMKAAEIVSKRILPTAQAVADNILATSAGQLTASWMVEGETAIGDQIMALEYVLSLVRHSAWGATELTNCYRFLLTQARKDGTLTRILTRDELKAELQVTNDPEFDLPLPDRISYQKAEWVKMGGNAIPTNFLVNEATRRYFQQLSDLNDQTVAIPEDITYDIVGDADRNTNWSELGSEALLALLHAAGIRDRISTDSHVVSCLVLSILHLTKSSNVTENFINRRVEQLMNLFSGLTLDGILTREAVVRYGQRFPSRGINADKVYEILSVYNAYFRTKNINPIVWIIEQSAAANVSSALAVANMIKKNAQAPYKRIIDHIGVDQVTTWASLVGELSYDRFCSIIDPPYPISTYPDLAYLGIRVDFGATRPGVTGGGYQGRPDTRARLSKANLDALAEMIINFGNIELESTVSLKNDLAIKYNQHKVLEVQGYFYIVPTAQLEDQADNARQLDEIDRVGWPRIMRNATRGTIRLSPSEAAVEIQGAEVNKRWYDALQGVAATMVKVSQQDVLPVIPEGQVNAVQRRQRLPESLIADLMVLGVNIKPEWRVAPPAITPQLVDQNDNRFNRYVRTYWGGERLTRASTLVPPPRRPANPTTQNVAGPSTSGNAQNPPQQSNWTPTGVINQVKDFLGAGHHEPTPSPGTPTPGTSTPKAGGGSVTIKSPPATRAHTPGSSPGYLSPLLAGTSQLPLGDIRNLMDPNTSQGSANDSLSSGEERTLQ